MRNKKNFVSVKNTFVLFLAVLLLCTGSVLKTDENAEGIIKNVANTYEELSSYQEEFETIINIEMKGIKTEVKMETSIACIQPNKLRLSVKQTMFETLLVSDGIKLWTYIGALNKYTECKCPESLGEISKTNPMISILLRDLIVPSLILSDNPYKKIMENVKKFRLLGTEVLNGKGVYLIEMDQESDMRSGEKISSQVKLWIEKSTYLIKKVTLSAEMNPKCKGGTCDLNEKMSVVITEKHPDIKFNVPIVDELFIFEPPEGAKKTDSFYAPPQPPSDIPSSLISKDAGDFTIEWLQGGSSTQLSSYENEKVVAFRVWSLWCERSQKEMPILQQVYDKYKDKDFVLIAVFPDESREAIREFMADKDYTFPIGFNSEGKVAGLYKIDAYPALVFIDRRGKIEKIRTGFISNLKETLENGVNRLVKNEPFPAEKEWTFQAETQKEKQTYAEKWYQVQRDLLIKSYKRSGIHNADWDDHVEKFLDLAAKNQFKIFPKVTDRDIIQAGEKLINIGCSDPLVLAYYGLQLAHAHRFDEARSAYEKSAQALEKSEYLKSIKHIAHLRLAETLIEMGEKYDKARNHLECCISSIPVLCKDMDDEYVFFHLKQITKAYNEIGKEEESKAWRDIVAVMNEKDAGSWLLTMCRVHAHIRYAWDARGGGWASAVTDDGWRIFKKELRIAEEEAHKAYQLHPERPQAFMLTIGTGLGYGDEWKERWFQRVITSDFDYYPAYSVKLWYLQSRWGGSHEERMTFGRECLATKRFDTFAPLIMIDVLEDAAERMTEDAWRMWMQAETWETVKTVFEGYLTQYPDDYWIRSRFVNFAVKCMQFEYASEELAKLGGLCYPRAFGEDDAKNEAFELAKAKIIAATSEGGKVFREALLYELKNRFELAEENYRKALSLAKSEEARNAINRKLSAIPMMKKHGASEEALMEGSEGYYMSGYKYKDEKKYDKAIKEYQKALALPPRKSKAYNGLALCYVKKRNRNKAIEFYKKAIKVKHDNALAWKNLGRAYWATKRYDEGIKACKEAIRIRPNFASAHFALGLIYTKLKRYCEAVESNKEAVRIDPEWVDAHHNLGGSYHNLGQYDKAVKACEKAIEMHEGPVPQGSEHAKVYHTLGAAYRKLGKHNKAIAAYKESLRIRPNNAGGYHDLGLVYYDMELYDKAIETFKKAIRIKPDFVLAYNNLGSIYSDIGQHDKAIEAYNKAIQIKSDYALAYYGLACCYSLLNDIDKAVKAMRKSLALGYDNIGHMSQDSDLANLRKDPRYKELITKSLFQKK